MINNKGDVSQGLLMVLGGLILALAIGGVLIYYTVTDYKAGVEGNIGAVICKESLDQTARRIEIPVIDSPIIQSQPKCKTYDIYITEEDLENQGEIFGREWRSELGLKRIIANILSIGDPKLTVKDDKGNLIENFFVPGVWSTVSRGEKQFFENEDGKFCLPWATISFAPEVQEKYPKVPGFNKFLFETKMANSETSYDLKYGFYLANSNENKKVTDYNLDIPQFFDTSKTYGVFFIQDVEKANLLKTIGVATGIAAGIIAVAFITFGTAGIGTAGIVLVAAELTKTTALAAGAGAIGGFTIGSQFGGYSAIVTIEEFEPGQISKLDCDYLK
ncbi:MAG: hypothetical protein HYS32_01625 [Candidatus Woesearchaeota archaeon]|nr:MAG: hypothetical protein HYS32_01625 [Candidatus Woesearchaeota archaeon]